MLPTNSKYSFKFYPRSIPASQKHPSQTTERLEINQAPSAEGAAANNSLYFKHREPPKINQDPVKKEQSGNSITIPLTPEKIKDQLIKNNLPITEVSQTNNTYVAHVNQVGLAKLVYSRIVPRQPTNHNQIPKETILAAIYNQLFTTLVKTAQELKIRHLVVPNFDSNTQAGINWNSNEKMPGFIWQLISQELMAVIKIAKNLQITVCGFCDKEQLRNLKIEMAEQTTFTGGAILVIDPSEVRRYENITNHTSKLLLYPNTLQDIFQTYTNQN